MKKLSPDSRSASEDPIARVTRRAADQCMAQREEILQAFAAKYGFSPEQAIQIEQQREDGTRTWRVESVEPETPTLNFRALCAELLEELDHMHSNYDVPRQSALIDRALNALAKPEPERPTEADMNDLADDLLGIVLPDGSGARLITRALELWGRPAIEPKELTDQEIAECLVAAGVDALEGESDGTNRMYWEGSHDQVLAGIRAVIAADRARWGRPAIKPVPVSERPILKSSDFNDAEGRCWCGTTAFTDERGDMPIDCPMAWELREPCAQDDCVLPHWALPTPNPIQSRQQEANQ